MEPFVATTEIRSYEIPIVRITTATVPLHDAFDHLIHSFEDGLTKHIGHRFWLYSLEKGLEVFQTLCSLR